MTNNQQKLFGPGVLLGFALVVFFALPVAWAVVNNFSDSVVIPSAKYYIMGTSSQYALGFNGTAATLNDAASNSFATVTDVGATGTLSWAGAAGVTGILTASNTANAIRVGTLCDLTTPPAIGGGTPAAITGTTVTASTNTGMAIPGYKWANNGTYMTHTDGTNVLTTLGHNGSAALLGMRSSTDTDAVVPAYQMHLINELTAAQGGGVRHLTVSQHPNAAAGALMRFVKSRTSFASPSTVVTGDEIGEFLGYAHDGTSYLSTIGFGFITSGTVATGSVPTNFVISADPAGFASFSAGEKARMTPTGDWGLGTTAPDRKLELNTGAATGGVRLTYNDSNGSAANYVDLLVDSGGDLQLTPSGSNILIPLDTLLNFGDATEGVYSNDNGYMDYFAATGHRFAGPVSGDGEIHGAQQDATPYTIPLINMRVWDAVNTILPGTPASDDLAIDNGTFLTSNPSVISSAVAGGAASTGYCRFQFVLPNEYVAAQTVTLRLNAVLGGDQVLGTATVDIEAVDTDDATSDICATAAQNITGSQGNKDFDITATNLTRGDTLDVRITIAITSGGLSDGVWGIIYEAVALLDIEG